MSFFIANRAVTYQKLTKGLRVCLMSMWCWRVLRERTKRRLRFMNVEGVL
jgi:hypothetical protein